MDEGCPTCKWNITKVHEKEIIYKKSKIGKITLLEMTLFVLKTVKCVLDAETLLILLIS